MGKRYRDVEVNRDGKIHTRRMLVNDGQDNASVQNNRQRANQSMNPFSDLSSGSAGGSGYGYGSKPYQQKFTGEESKLFDSISSHERKTPQDLATIKDHLMNRGQYWANANQALYRDNALDRIRIPRDNQLTDDTRKSLERATGQSGGGIIGGLRRAFAREEPVTWQEGFRAYLKNISDEKTYESNRVGDGQVRFPRGQNVSYDDHNRIDNLTDQQLYNIAIENGVTEGDNMAQSMSDAHLRRSMINGQMMARHQPEDRNPSYGNQSAMFGQQQSPFGSIGGQKTVFEQERDKKIQQENENRRPPSSFRNAANRLIGAMDIIR